LTESGSWLGYNNYLDLPQGLQPSAKHFAAHHAYQRLSLWWAEHLSEHYRLEDAPSDDMKTPVEVYQKLSNDALKRAIDLRNHFYEGRGEELKPRSRSILGYIPEQVPRR